MYDDDTAKTNERVAATDQTAAVGPELLGGLLDRHAAAMELYARQWCRTPEDVVQQAFVQLARQTTVPDNIVTWLYRVVRNGAISAGRAEARRQRYETAAAKMAASWFVPTEPPGLDGAAVTAAVETLSADEREVIVAHLWSGLTFQEIAEIAGVSSSTAHRRYEQGLRILRSKLTKPEQDHVI
ncbi:MAG TPA: sigma-70 family RNA polymerase sigma factor [Pirellulales bacterium]|nr:sigma-70 family RNA polymerase sigma factor [Pirellulales bacterium]